MARRVLAVLHVSPVARGRDQLLCAGREHLLQNGLLSVSGDREWEIKRIFIRRWRIRNTISERAFDELFQDKSPSTGNYGYTRWIRCRSVLIKIATRNSKWYGCLANVNAIMPLWPVGGGSGCICGWRQYLSIIVVPTLLDIIFRKERIAGFYFCQEILRDSYSSGGCCIYK